MEGHFTENNKITRGMPPVAAGQATNTGDIIDTQGFDCCTFVLMLGDNTDAGTVTFQVQQGAAANMSDGAALAGTSIQSAWSSDNGDNMVMILEVNHPRERYLRCQVITATQNSQIGGVIAILSKPRSKPITACASYVVDTTVLDNAAEA